MVRLHPVAALGLTLCAACGGGEGRPDVATFVDAGHRDSGALRLDSGVLRDAGPEDTGIVEDAGFPDSGVVPDASAPDSGVVPDAGLEDTGVVEDAGVADSGEPPDAAAPDAGAPDTGVLDSGPIDSGVHPDAGPIDTGLFADAGPVDSGLHPDAAVPDSGVHPDAGPVVPAYTIDGDLLDWSNPAAVLVNLGYSGGGLWGGDNRFEELRVDGDANYLYVGYQYRASGNSVIVYIDTGTGGALSASMLDAWPRLVTVAAPADVFIAQYEGSAVQLRDIASANSAPFISGPYDVATGGAAPGYTTELAIPWSTLGLGAGPHPLTFFAAIVGGDNYGGGDIAPNANSVPVANGNNIDTASSNAISFSQGFSVTLP